MLERRKNRWKEEGRNESHLNRGRTFKIRVQMKYKLSPWSAEVQGKDPFPSCFLSWRGSSILKKLRSFRQPGDRVMEQIGPGIHRGKVLWGERIGGLCNPNGSQLPAETLVHLSRKALWKDSPVHNSYLGACSWIVPVFGPPKDAPMIPLGPKN